MQDVRFVVFHRPGPAWLPGKVMFDQPGSVSTSHTIGSGGSQASSNSAARTSTRAVAE